MYVNVYKDTKSMFIILNLGLPPTYPTIMANNFEVGPSHINSNVNTSKFYIIYIYKALTIIFLYIITPIEHFI